MSALSQILEMPVRVRRERIQPLKGFFTKYAFSAFDWKREKERENAKIK